MTDQLWVAILSSSLLAGIFGAFIAGAFNLRGKRNDYVNDYFKLVVKRRVEAYESLEALINALKLCIYDNDHQLYHHVFSSVGGWPEIYKLFLDATANPLWLGDELFSKTRELNIMFLQASHEGRDPVEFGKANYKPIAELREQIERLHARDMATLHDVEGFLKSHKGNQSGFALIDLRG